MYIKVYLKSISGCFKAQLAGVLGPSRYQLAWPPHLRTRRQLYRRPPGLSRGPLVDLEDLTSFWLHSEVA